MEAMSEPGYSIPLEDVLESVEREQLAAGIREKGSTTDRGHTSFSSDTKNTHQKRYKTSLTTQGSTADEL